MTTFQQRWAEATARCERPNDIGVPGAPGFGVGLYPSSRLPSGFSEMAGTRDRRSPNFGNYQYSDGSVMVWRPAFYYRIGHPNNPTFAAHGANSIDIQPEHAFAGRDAAALAGYALHRAFINAGEQQRGFMLDKYQCSNNGGIASSLKNGNPLSSAAAHNPFSGLAGAPGNNYAGALDAAKTRGSQFHCASRFEFVTGAMISLAHGQRATPETCAWYDASGVLNFPKGNNANTNPPRDVNDSSVVYTSDGYSNCGKTGSAGLFAKTTDNGQACGAADLNGNMWEINTGIVRTGASATDTAQQNDAAAFYVLKESVDVNTLTSGWNSGATGSQAAWGDAAHLATLYDPITLAHIVNTGVGNRFGNGVNQALSESTAGDGWRMTGAGIYLPAGKSAGGTAQFGNDGLYEYHRANLCLLAGGDWNYTSSAGVWAVSLASYRTSSNASVGLRASCYC
jgi:hypothetical protein